ncbi:hypothetical protein [Actinoplanes xinjiangensis]|uniref:hypothetical protein n=1 Tax=Actinoplanes xinjiangensis TaxID=512350 RepID=UPI003412D484
MGAFDDNHTPADQGGAPDGLALCLGPSGTEFVRTDRRRDELGVIDVSEPDGFAYRAAVLVRCFTEQP